MARIRSIKPGFFTSEDVSPLPFRARLTWIGLWTHCDDQGRAKDNTKLIKAAVWPLDAVTLGEIEEDLATLADHGRIVRYEVDGKRFLAVTNWSDHQRPNKPTPSRLPAPTAANRRRWPTDEYDPPPEGLPDDSLTTPVGLPHDSRRTPVGRGGEGSSRGEEGSARAHEAVAHIAGEYRLTDQEAAQVWAVAEQRSAEPIAHPIAYLRRMAETADLADIVNEVAYSDPPPALHVVETPSATGCDRHPAGAVDPEAPDGSRCLLCNTESRRGTRARRPA